MDLLFELGFVFDRDERNFAWLDHALISGDFTSPTTPSWRWSGVVEDVGIRLDLLCDVPDHSGQPIVLPGAAHVVFQNLAGPAPALLDPITRKIAVPPSVRSDHPDAPATVELRFANLGGYLLAKASAFASRRAEKDVYVFMFVTLYNPDGVIGAARAVARQLGLVHDPWTALDAVKSLLAGFLDDGKHPGTFAAALRSAGDESAPVQLRTDAVIAAHRFLEEMDVGWGQ